MKKLAVACAVACAAVLALSVMGCSGSTASKASEVGDTIEIGQLDGDSLSWTVLEIDGDEALVIAEDELETRMAYDSLKEEDTAAKLTWETSEIRTWLNGTFLDDFSDSDLEKIVETEVSTEAGKTGISGGNATTDKVFLMSVDEITKYLPEQEDRADPNGGWYYLRTPGSEQGTQACVLGDGDMNAYGFDADATGGIRPAMWITIS